MEENKLNMEQSEEVDIQKTKAKKKKKSKKSKRTSPLLLGVLALLFVVVVVLIVVVVKLNSRLDSVSQPAPQVEQPRSTSPSSYSQPAGLYPFTSQRKVTYDDIAYLSSSELRIMRNEIYARHGYIFKSKDLRNYFLSQGWYEPMTYDVVLSTIEQYNVNFIKQYE